MASTVQDLMVTDPVTCPSTTTIAEGARIMRDRSVRRLPVVTDGRAVGIVTLGDLAMERDPNSALGDISAAGPSS